MRAGQLVFAWIVLTVRLIIARPRAVLWSQWRFSFEPMFASLASILLPKTIFGIIAHEPVPRSDAKDTSRHKTGGLIEFAFGTAWRRLDLAFVLGSKTRDLAISHWRPRCPVYVIPHGSESGLRGGATVRNVADTDPVALFFGVWSKYKGIDVLLQAFETVHGLYPEARLVLAGAVGADVDADEILTRSRAIGNVDAHPGYVPIEDVPALLDAARVVVAPYVRATQSGAAHLAYTFGRPVIASAVGDLPEAVEDGVTGLLVPAGDAEALAVAILRLLREPALAARLGAVGERRVANASAAAAREVCEALAKAGETDGAHR